MNLFIYYLFLRLFIYFVFIYLVFNCLNVFRLICHNMAKLEFKFNCFTNFVEAKKQLYTDRPQKIDQSSSDDDTATPSNVISKPPSSSPIFAPTSAPQSLAAIPSVPLTPPGTN